MASRLDKLRWALGYGCISGSVAFGWVLGWRYLKPTFYQWLMWGDPATFYLGWLFFRDTPWQWPPGLNPNYGMSLGSSIVYSDSVPLFALLFKPFSGWLAPTFHYFGLWLLTCLVLQGVSAWCLMTRITNKQTLRCVGASFFVCAPILLERISGHFSLVSQWLIICALGLGFSLRFCAWRWVALLACAAAIHAYLLAMVAALWLADLVQRARQGAVTKRDLAGIAASIPAVGIVMWLAGYFVLGAKLGTKGYGFFRFNLLSLFDPDASWSRVLPDVPQGAGDHEGFAYVGSGMLVLMVIATLSVLQRRSVLSGARRYGLVVIACVLMMIYALSNRVAMGSVELFQVPYPIFLARFFEMFRSTGRFAWPLVYLLSFATIHIVIRRFSERVALVVLSAALIFQVSDMRGAIRAQQMDRLRVESEWQSPLRSKFWAYAAKRYNRIYCVPSATFIPYYEHMALFAALHRMPINVGYLARVDEDKLRRSNKNLIEDVSSGRFAPNALYYFRERNLWHEIAAHKRATDLAEIIDGVMVLAPGWYGHINQTR